MGVYNPQIAIVIKFHARHAYIVYHTWVGCRYRALERAVFVIVMRYKGSSRNS